MDQGSHTGWAHSDTQEMNTMNGVKKSLVIPIFLQNYVRVPRQYVTGNGSISGYCNEIQNEHKNRVTHSQRVH